MPQKLLDAFQHVFQGQFVSAPEFEQGGPDCLVSYEDLYDLNQSPVYHTGIQQGSLVYNRGNRVVGPIIGGVRVRRGDGLFGQAVPGQPLVPEPGFAVQRGHVANIRIGIEIKIVSTAMARQFDRVMTGIIDQHSVFKRVSDDCITVVMVAVNHAVEYESYEGDRVFRATPIDEAAKTMRRFAHELASVNLYDEVLLVAFAASNIAPFPFAWTNWQATYAAYNASLVRLGNAYESRFG